MTPIYEAAGASGGSSRAYETELPTHHDAQNLRRTRSTWRLTSVFTPFLLLTAVLCLTTGAHANQLLTATPSSINFGHVIINKSSTQTVTLTNTGNSSLKITWDTVTGTGFSISGLTLPLTLAAGQSTTFKVTFAPKATGTVIGSIWIFAYNDAALYISRPPLPYRSREPGSRCLSVKNPPAPVSGISFWVAAVRCL